MTKSEFSSSKVLILVHDELELNFDNSIFPHDHCAEWESRQTIEMLEASWQKLGYHVVTTPLNRNFFSLWDKYLSKITLVHSVVEGWGSSAREGWLASLCELSGIPYVGTGPLGQNICMRKDLVKLACLNLNVPTAEFHRITKIEQIELVPSDFWQKPHFVKPNAEGSGMGISKESSLGSEFTSSKETILELLEKYQDVLLEEYLPGREFTSGFIGSPFLFLPIAEIEVPDGVYGLAMKGKDKMEEKVSFPELPEQWYSVIKKGTELLGEYFDLQDFSRFDWKINSEGVPCLLEINPLAGLSFYYSVLPKMAEKAGFNYTEFLNTIALSALQKDKSKVLKYGKAVMTKP